MVHHGNASPTVAYVDLALLHWPAPTGKPRPGAISGAAARAAAWRGLQRAYAEGVARAIGVSNFTAAHLEELLGASGVAVVPAVNQVEVTPLYPQRALRAWCAERGVVVQAYSSLGVGLTADNVGEAAMAAVCRNTSAMGGAAATPQPQLLDHPTVQAIAERRGCGSAEVLLLWALQQEPPVPVIPKSISPERISANAAVRRAVPLRDSDMQMLDRLENGHKFAWDPSAVD